MFPMFWFLRLAASVGFWSCCDFDVSPPCCPPVAAPACAPRTCPATHPTLVKNTAAFAAPAPVYQVEVRQTGRGDNTLTWPKVTLSEGQRFFVTAQGKEGQAKPWVMALHLKKADGEKAVVQVGLTGRPTGEQVCTYQGTFGVKLGVCNLTAMGGENLPEPLAMSVCVKQMPTPPVAAPQVPKRAPVPTATLMPPPLPVAPTMVATAPFPAASPYAPPVPYPTYPVVQPFVPVYPPMPPMPMMPTPVMPVVNRVVVPVMNKTVQVVHHDGKPHLEMKYGKMTSTVVRMTVDEAPTGKLTMAAGMKYVHVTGDDFKASAEKVEVCDCCVVLSGQVKLHCEKLGSNATVTADRVCVKVKDGRFVELMKGCGTGCCPARATRPAVRIITPTRSTGADGLERIGIDFNR